MTWTKPFICYTLQHFLVCFKMCSLNNGHGKVWNKRYNILRFINTYPCLASQPISTLTPTHQNHMSTSTHVLAYFYLGAPAILSYTFSEQLQVNLQACPGLEATRVHWLKGQIHAEEGKESTVPLGSSTYSESTVRSPLEARSQNPWDVGAAANNSQMSQLRYREGKSLPW